MLKKSLLLAVCLCFCAVGLVRAAENKAASEIAPLVEESTCVVLHVDLSRLNLAQTLESLTDTVESVMTQTVPKEQLNDQLPMVKMAIGGVGMMAMNYVNILTNQGKANDFYFLVDANDVQSGTIAGILVTPAGNKGKNETDAIRKVFSDLNMPVSFVRHGFVIVAVPANPAVDEDDLREFVKTRFRDVTPVAKPEIAEAFTAFGDVTLQGVFIISKAFGDQIEQTAKLQMEMQVDDSLFSLDEQKKLLTLITTKFQWGGFAFDLVNPRFHGIYQFRDNAGAKEAFDFMKKMIELVAVVNNSADAISGVGEQITKILFGKAMIEPTGNRLELRVDEKNFGTLMSDIQAEVQTLMGAGQ